MTNGRKVQILLLIVVAASAVVLFFWNDFAIFYSSFSLNLPEIGGEIGKVIERTGEQISAPPPLKSENESEEGILTRKGVISLTNAQREKFGLPALAESANLDESAALKVKDMFENQYFAHVSPSGVGVAEISQASGYNFIIIGENLASGNFADDQALVQAWMDSPGHRENILNSRYQDIGVAVEKGMYEGKMTWMAVQHFGQPLSACPQPLEFLKEQIDDNEAEISKLQEDLAVLRQELQSVRPRNKAEYNQKIDQYNNLVSEYNELVEETKTLVDQYNASVRAFNACASGT